MPAEFFEQKMAIVPKKPGCYLWKNLNNEIIYIGKAKNLFNRTHSYFTGSNNLRTQKMVSEIYDLDYIVVKSENEALILESTLINKHQPKYNILLRENNLYPYLFLTNEPKPRLFYTKNKITHLTGKYFGPFAVSGTRPWELYNLLKKILPIQDCKHKWNKECFNCEILKRIQIPILKSNQQDFKSIVNLINNILQGKSKPLINYLENQELYHKNNFEFEDAQKFLNLRKALNEINQNKYVQVNQSKIDIIGFKVDENFVAINIFTWIDQKLISKTEKVLHYLDDWRETFNYFLYEFYKTQKSNFKVYLSFIDEKIKLLEQHLKIKFITPLKGQFLDLMTTAMHNAEFNLQKHNLKNYGRENSRKQVNNQLKELLGLAKLERIEIFDISQFFGTNPVGAMVVYENGIANKKQYRKFIIKEAEGNSDLDYMKEVIYRRYTRLLDRNWVLPDLVIVDGGQTHLNLLNNCLKNLGLNFATASLVKDKKHRTRALIYQDQELKISDPNLLHYLTTIQDETHRFAITFFKNRNIKSQFQSVLESVKGLGPKKIKLLLEKYETVRQLQKVPIEELAQIIPQQVAIELEAKLEEFMKQQTALQAQLTKKMNR